MGLVDRSTPCIQCVIHLSENSVYHERTKHIDVRYHFIRDIIGKGDIEAKKVHTSDNPADMITIRLDQLANLGIAWTC